MVIHLFLHILQIQEVNKNSIGDINLQQIISNRVSYYLKIFNNSFLLNNKF